MGACTTKNSKTNATRDFIIDPSNFVKVKKVNIRTYYDIKDKIAEGDFGTVYLAKHKQTGKRRAVKFIPISGPKSCDIHNLLREVAILKSMDHVNIIKVYEVYQDDMYIHIVTEYCKGGELFDRIVKQGYISENQAARYMLQMASAVQYLHARGIVHRDLQPENIIFETNDVDSNLKLVNF